MSKSNGKEVTLPSKPETLTLSHENPEISNDRDLSKHDPTQCTSVDQILEQLIDSTKGQEKAFPPLGLPTQPQVETSELIEKIRMLEEANTELKMKVKILESWAMNAGSLLNRTSANLTMEISSIKNMDEALVRLYKIVKNIQDRTLIIEKTVQRQASAAEEEVDTSTSANDKKREGEPNYSIKNAKKSRLRSSAVEQEQKPL